MMIDWLTIRVPYEALSDAALAVVLTIGDRITRYCPKTGEQRWTSTAWDSIRSDSHQITCRAGGTEFWLQGSPARVIGDGDAVFGAGASAALDLKGCADHMIRFIGGHLGIQLPGPDAWICSRVDVTENLAMGSLAEVRQALTVLRDCEGGRYRVSAKSGDSVYWSPKSKLRKAKAYAKGPHLVHLMKQRGHTGRQYTADEITHADRLLRLELTLGREWFRRHDWLHVTPDDLTAEWNSYFDRMIGDAEMCGEDDVKDRVFQVAPTDGQARAALGLWALIQARGWEAARELNSPRTWYRNLKILRAAGLGDADLSKGQVVSIRRRVIEAQAVNSWAALRAA
ncbi:hypothetical protein MLD55_14160 [Alcanivorax sp. MM125-6]|nr:hypothetical protein [Alcanivorax sp. MM125-6]